MGASDQRGQAFTLEAVVAAIVLLTAVAFALQVTIVTPLSASTSSQHIEGQQRSVAQGALASAAEDGSLKEAILYRNQTARQFHNTGDQGFYTDDPPDIEFGEKLDQAFTEQGIAYNVLVRYQVGEEAIDTEEMILQGTPSDNAVSATWTISLRNDDHVINEDGSRNETTVRESDRFYIPNGPADNAKSSDNGLYNVVTVEVVAWRI
ncbi:DUF7288 family protein [Halovenus sp. HT40]|uniref:DUF7288 family protein n=1 Tax=Halovenus sp. HT40 TaxID=3126691 RepID=UPI00300EC316